MVRSHHLCISILLVAIFPATLFAANEPQARPMIIGTVIDRRIEGAGQVVVPGHIRVHFDTRVAGIGPGKALEVVRIYQKYGDQVATMLGTPYPPSHEIQVYLHLAGVSNGNVIRDPASRDKEPAIMNIFTNPRSPVKTTLVHELAHVFLDNEGLCTDMHMCETMSQLVEHRIAPDAVFPSDLPLFMNMTTDRQHPVAGMFDSGKFDSLLDEWLTSKKKGVRGADYTFARLLGDLMVRRMGLERSPDLSAITARLAAAHGARSANGVAKALGFSGLAALRDAMRADYAENMREIERNPGLRALFEREWNEIMGYFAEVPPPFTPPVFPTLPYSAPSAAKPGIPIGSFPPYPAERPGVGLRFQIPGIVPIPPASALPGPYALPHIPLPQLPPAPIQPTALPIITR